MRRIERVNKVHNFVLVFTAVPWLSFIPHVMVWLCCYRGHFCSQTNWNHVTHHQQVWREEEEEDRRKLASHQDCQTKPKLTKTPFHLFTGTSRKDLAWLKEQGLSWSPWQWSLLRKHRTCLCAPPPPYNPRYSCALYLVFFFFFNLFLKQTCLR